MESEFRDEDLDFEIQFYEGLLSKKKDFLQALVALADLYTKKGWYDKGLEIDKKLSYYIPNDPFVLYNLACSYSLVNDRDMAFATIKKAFDCGYDDLQQLEADQDLVNLRNDERFQKYLQKIIAQKMKEQK